MSNYFVICADHSTKQLLVLTFPQTHTQFGLFSASSMFTHLTVMLLFNNSDIHPVLILAETELTVKVKQTLDILKTTCGFSQHTDMFKLLQHVC